MYIHICAVLIVRDASRTFEIFLGTRRVTPLPSFLDAPTSS